MYSIDITPDYPIFDDVLSYACTFDNIKCFNTDGLKYDPLHDKEENKYIVSLKLDAGKYEINLDDHNIIVEYIINYEKPVGLSHLVKCHEILKIFSEESKEILEDFVKKAYLYNRPKTENMIDITIFKNFWSKLNKLPMRNIDTVYLDKEIKNNLLTDVNQFIEEEDVYNEFGIPYKRTYLFEGLPGSGKTSMIFALASKLEMNISIFNFGPDVDDAVFMKAISTLPENSILLLEDVDALFVERESKIKSCITFSGILNTLDGVSRRHKLITFITTNYVEKLDSALLRPGRIDYIIKFTYASKEQIEMMFKRFRPNDNTFDKFYNKIKHNEYSTAILQKFFFTHRKKESILDITNELNNIKNAHSHEPSRALDNMYI